MSVGISLLVHQNLNQVIQLVEALSKAGCKVAIHVDSKVPDGEYKPFHQTVSAFENIVFSPRISCEWGRFSLVEAQLETAAVLLAKFQGISHIVQLSGSCLPNRPLSELQAFLSLNKGVDFIESVIVGGANWTKGGLEAERFNLHFPFSFEKRRRVFDIFVALQRKLGVKRQIPAGLIPHIGSQWWALSTETMQAILSDPERSNYKKYFEKCWIPDESYFQTLARKHCKKIKSRSLTFSRFDFRGKPMVFYEDHARFIKHLDSFFIRKVWPGAHQLYRDLLSLEQKPSPRNPDMAVAFHASIEKAESRWLNGRPGLLMQSRAPLLPLVSTAAPYTVLSGFDRVFSGLPAWLLQHTGVTLFESLFTSDQAAFAKTALGLKGNLGISCKARNYNAEGFLLNFIWNHSDDDPTFCFDPLDNTSVAQFITRDPNARIFHIRSVWLLELLRKNERDITKLRPLVQAYTLKEQAQLAALAKGKSKVQIIPLEEVYAQPGAVLEDLIFTLRPALSSHNRDLPPFLPFEGLEEYIEFLKDAGLNLSVDIDRRTKLAGQIA